MYIGRPPTTSRDNRQWLLGNQEKCSKEREYNGLDKNMLHYKHVVHGFMLVQFLEEYHQNRVLSGGHKHPLYMLAYLEQ